jgi:hypothetical protein
MLRRLLGFASWDAYGGLPPEEFAHQQRRRRGLWFAVVIAGLMAVLWFW